VIFNDAVGSRVEPEFLEWVAWTAGSAVRVSWFADPQIRSKAADQPEQKPQTANPAVCATSLINRGSVRANMGGIREDWEEAEN